MASRTVSVALVADVGQYQSAMVRAAATTKTVGESATAAGTKAQRGFEAAGRGATLLAGVAAGGLVLGLKSAVDAASNAEQSIGGVQAVYKDYAASVIASSKEADRALGLSANSYRELATIIGSQMKNAGVPLAELADKTEVIIGIGADLAAQFGGSTQEAVNALSSAFRGELDPIERYGISLTAAAVGAKAVELGLAESATGLSQNAKAMATLAIITEQSADAQGAFGRESDTAAGRAQRAAAQWENLKVAVGDRLLPAWSALVDVLGTKVIPFLGDVLDAGGDLVKFMMDNKEVALALAGVLAVQLAGGIGAVTVAFNSMILTPAVLGLTGLLGVAGNLPAAFAAARTAVAGFAAAAAPLVAVGSIVYAIAKTIDFATAAGDARKEVRGMWDAVDNSRGSAQLDAMASVIDQIETKIRSLNDELPETEGAFQGLLSPTGMLENGGAVKALDEYEEALIRAKEAQAAANVTADGLATRFHTSRSQVLALAETYDIDLSQGLDSVAGKFRTSAEAAAVAGDGLVQVGNSAGMTQEQIEEAAKAVEDWLAELQKIGSGFVEPLGVYQELLGQKEEAERASAEATAAATSSSTDSWKDYVGDVTVSLDEYATQLEEQIAAQENWRANVVTVTQRGGLEVGQILAGMGVEGAQITAQMANATDAEFRRMADALIADARLGGQGAAQELDLAMKVMAIVARDGSRTTVGAITSELGIGVQQVADIAARYGIELAGGINPLLTALGKNRISGVNGRVGGLTEADGGIVSYYANGGLEDHRAQIAPAGAWRVWAEPETGGEGYVPLAPAKRSQSLPIWREIGRRLNAPEAQFFADGGFASAGDVPKPFSTAPYGVPISTAGNATMEKGYNEVLAFLAANAGGVAGSGAVGGDWESIFNWVKARVPQARANSTYRPGDPGYHGKGKAVDFGFGPGPGGAGSAGLASINRLLHDGIGKNLAELIYDGIGDDRPDLWHGGPHTYSKATQKEHQNHVHAAVYDQGGWLQPGYTMAYNGTGTPERVLTSREFSGGGRGGGGGAVTVAPPQVTVHFHVDGQEFRGMTRTEVDHQLGALADRVLYAGM